VIDESKFPPIPSKIQERIMSRSVVTENPAGVRQIACDPLTKVIGAEIRGVDLGGPLSDADIKAIERALVEYKVLVFRDQRMTAEQQVSLGRRFGELEVHPFLQNKGFEGDGRNPEIVVIDNVVAESWHSDTTFRERPSLGSILRMTHVPERGGDTMWADMSAAYDDLDSATQSFLSGLVAIHDWELFRRLLRGKMSTEAIEDLNRKFPPVEHPVIRTHPVSGRKIVYVNDNFTISIKGMAESESKALLQRLYDLAKIPEYQVRLRWRPGTIAFWDNRSTQHRVVNDVVGNRRAERVTIVGDRPF
jgi:taurine dioxygenase